jgi:hypothetical protein
VNGETTAETWVEVPSGWTLSFSGARPNPSSNGFSIGFSLTRPGDAALRVLDVTGREVARGDWHGLPVGSHLVSLGAPAQLAPGVYLLELSAEGRRLHRKAVVTR